MKSIVYFLPLLFLFLVSGCWMGGPPLILLKSPDGAKLVLRGNVSYAKKYEKGDFVDLYINESLLEWSFDEREGYKKFYSNLQIVRVEEKAKKSGYLKLQMLGSKKVVATPDLYIPIDLEEGDTVVAVTTPSCLLLNYLSSRKKDFYVVGKIVLD